MANLKRVDLRGFKSIKEASLDLRSLNVLIGANGAGKTNLVSFFKMLNEMIDERLQQFIAVEGRAQSVLHFGPKHTQQMEATLEFESEDGPATYYQRLIHVAGDTLAFADEWVEALATGSSISHSLRLGTGHLESRLGEKADFGDPTAKVLRDLLIECRVYHFHDTSATAHVRRHSYIGDTRALRHDAGNLAALLYRLREETNRSAYQRIVSTIRLIAPFFADFELEPTGPNKDQTILNWRENGSDQVFGPHQLSDGTLRAICLITLLLQPEDELPALIIVDEPELGLHPYALNVVASLFSKAAQHAQVLVSTQSSSFLDNFEADDVIVVDRQGNGSTFIRHDPLALTAWLEEYSLGEIWEKNVIGGGPH